MLMRQRLLSFHVSLPQSFVPVHQPTTKKSLAFFDSNGQKSPGAMKVGILVVLDEGIQEH
ncbi:hypothetical protein BGZ46_002003 [Entomortierella lignicola]|nr:hypothetical protein BGZ46_002003 [Entomortierella lignicola]